jgi:hypothetical protein
MTGSTWRAKIVPFLLPTTVRDRRRTRFPHVCPINVVMRSDTQLSPSRPGPQRSTSAANPACRTRAPTTVRHEIPLLVRDGEGDCEQEDPAQQATQCCMPTR